MLLPDPRQCSCGSASAVSTMIGVVWHAGSSGEPGRSRSRPSIGISISTKMRSGPLGLCDLDARGPSGTVSGSNPCAARAGGQSLSHSWQPSSRNARACQSTAPAPASTRRRLFPSSTSRCHCASTETFRGKLLSALRCGLSSISASAESPVRPLRAAEEKTESDPTEINGEPCEIRFSYVLGVKRIDGPDFAGSLAGIQHLVDGFLSSPPDG